MADPRDHDAAIWVITMAGIRTETLRSHVESAFHSASGQLARLADDRWSRYIFAFVAPWTSTLKNRGIVDENHVEQFAGACADVDDCSAVWTFPTWARDRHTRAGGRKTFYPGVALFARKL